MAAPQDSILERSPVPRFSANYFGRLAVRFVLTAQGIGAFGLITLGVLLTKLRSARQVIFPSISHELARSGLSLLPLFLFVSAMVGLVVIGQAVSWLSQVNATNFLGTIMVLVVVRELGPLLTALLVLLRAGTTIVVELGTTRALGEIEALEVLGIDPVHYFVMPRVIGMGLGLAALSVYFIISSIFFGYVWAFVQNVPLLPGEYFHQLVNSLSWIDFAVIALKSFLFGVCIALITCYHGLAQPLRLAEVARATTGAIGQCIVAILLIDALFILLYLSL